MGGGECGIVVILNTGLNKKEEQLSSSSIFISVLRVRSYF